MTKRIIIRKNCRATLLHINSAVVVASHICFLCGLFSIQLNPHQYHLARNAIHVTFSVYKQFVDGIRAFLLDSQRTSK